MRVCPQFSQQRAVFRDFDTRANALDSFPSAAGQRLAGEGCVLEVPAFKEAIHELREHIDRSAPPAPRTPHRRSARRFCVGDGGDGAGHLPGRPAEGWLQAAGRHRADRPPAHLLLRFGEHQRHADRSLGPGRLGRIAHAVVGRLLPGGRQLLPVGEALRPRGQGRHQAAHRRPGLDLRAGRGVRRVPLRGPDDHRVPAAHRPAVHQPERQPDDSEHVRGVHAVGRGRRRLVRRAATSPRRSCATPTASSGCRTSPAAPATRKVSRSPG